MDALTIVGAGGIGCAVGHSLAGAGVDITFVEADEGKLAHGRQHGVGLGHLPPRRATFVPFADWRPQPGQTVLLCTKGYDNAAILDRLSPAVNLIPIQNGFDPVLQTWPA